MWVGETTLAQTFLRDKSRNDVTGSDDWQFGEVRLNMETLPVAIINGHTINDTERTRNYGS